MTEAQLVADHAAWVRRYARGYGWDLPGADRDDLEQEALIGLWLAARDYRPELGLPFRRFARMCVRRRMVDALKRHNAAKHHTLTEAQRWARLEDGTSGAETWIPDPGADVFAQVAQTEALISILRACGTLTQVERCAFFGVIQGRSYAELGPVKQVDNALQRAKRKLRAAA